jgi:hypothetical protein
MPLVVASSPESVRKLGTASLVANIVVIFGLGLLSIPGAFLAARARRLADDDLPAAQRALRWSGLLLLANLLLYLMLAVVIGVIALSMLAAQT